MSITLALPDKYVRKAIYDLLNGMTVDSQTINTYDSQVPASESESAYILMTTQTNQVDESVKCGDQWRSSILLDIVTKYNKTTNPGSRLLADNITEEVRNRLESDLTLGGGLNVVHQKLDLPNDITSTSETENVFRKFVRVELLIN